MSRLSGRVSQGRRTTAPEAEMAERLLAGRVTAVLRLLLLPILFIGNSLFAHPRVSALLFDAIFAVAAVYSVLALTSSWRRTRNGKYHGVTLFIDLLLISALAFCSGRGFPQIRSAFVVAPMAAAFRLSPRRTAAMSAVIVAVYILVALTHPTRQQPHVIAVLAHSMFIVWTGVAAVALSALRVRRQRQILALSEARGRLVAQTIDTEERVRKRVSGVLHDHVIQGLLTARQELTEARAGDRRAVSRVEHALDEALGHLRNTIEDLDPYLLDYLDLPAAIRAIAGREARRGGYRVEINTQPDALGVHDALIAALSRELLSNAARHANASVVKLELTHRDGDVVLEVADDGRGFTREQAVTAVRHGHIGLAASRERVEAIGGSFVIDSHPGAGTRIRCNLPAQPEPALSATGMSVSDVREPSSLMGRVPA